MISKMAFVGEGARVAASARVWDFAHVESEAVLGENVVVGRGAHVGRQVVVGDNSKIQNNALIYAPAVIGPGVFVGPSVVLTNDRFPRACAPDGRQKNSTDWRAVGVTIHEGASIGASAVCVAPVEIGAWAMIAAGAVVIADVPEFALVAGNPAHLIAWVGKAGVRVEPVGDLPGEYECPVTHERFRVVGEKLTEVVT